MCHTAIALTSKALNEVSNAEILLKIKGVIALFIQTMEVRRCWPSTTTLLKICLTVLFLGMGVLRFDLGQFLAHFVRKIRRAAETAI